MSCHVMSCHVMSCHVMSCHVMSCHFPHFEVGFDTGTVRASDQLSWCGCPCVCALYADVFFFCIVMAHASVTL